MSIIQRIRKLERETKDRKEKAETGFCVCKQVQYFFKVKGYTEEQNKALFNGGNIKYCPVCKRKNPVITVNDPAVLREE